MSCLTNGKGDGFHPSPLFHEKHRSYAFISYKIRKYGKNSFGALIYQDLTIKDELRTVFP